MNAVELIANILTPQFLHILLVDSYSHQMISMLNYDTLVGCI